MKFFFCVVVKQPEVPTDLIIIDVGIHHVTINVKESATEYELRGKKHIVFPIFEILFKNHLNILKKIKFLPEGDFCKNRIKAYKFFQIDR